jgi:hypothetical protein
VLVEERLTKSQRIPQASHAVAEFINYHRDNPVVQDWIKNHRTMVCLKAPDGEMDDYLDVYGYQDIPVMPWHDDDLPEDIWPHAAVYGPMTKVMGDEFLSHLKLA